MSDVSLGPTPIPELTHIMIGLESCSFLVSINLKSFFFGCPVLDKFQNAIYKYYYVNSGTVAADAARTDKQLFHSRFDEGTDLFTPLLPCYFLALFLPLYLCQTVESSAIS